VLPLTGETIYINQLTEEQSLGWDFDCMPEHSSLGDPNRWEAVDDTYLYTQPASPPSKIAWPVFNGKNVRDTNFWGEHQGALNKELKKARCKRKGGADCKL
jgi:hypothetical protein